ncbi:MAG: hypothetical protein EAZ42_01140 [Verrucomicrobia bacterium]|nr:MAG: hypothetical protein EAZ42_01140 [Verrucomicrobiota bacterium]
MYRQNLDGWRIQIIVKHLVCQLEEETIASQWLLKTAMPKHPARHPHEGYGGEEKGFETPFLRKNMEKILANPKGCKPLLHRRSPLSGLIASFIPFRVADFNFKNLAW